MDLAQYRVNSKQVRRDAALGSIGNILDDSVPVSKDEDKDNKVVSIWGINVFGSGSIYFSEAI